MRKVLKKLSVIFWLTPAFIAAAIYFILPRFPTIAEYVFARGIFRVFSFIIGGFSSLIPISIGELLVFLAIPLLVLVIFLFIRRLKKTDSKKATVFGFIKGAVFTLSCIPFIYMLMHGANYYRYSLDKLMGLDTSPKSAQFLYEVTCDLAEKVSAERLNCEVDENGRMVLSDSYFNTLNKVENGYEKLYDKYPFLRGIVKRAKPVMLLSHAWSYTGFSGVYFVWMGEPNVNIDMSDFTIPSCAAHELAHTRGFAREDECNFLAYLSSISSDYSEYRYAGYMIAFRNCINQLYKADKELFYEAYSHLSQEAYDDLMAHNEYLKQFEGKVNEASSSFNDTFIKAQGVASGAKSYGEMVDLVLAYYEKENIIS